MNNFSKSTFLKVFILFILLIGITLGKDKTELSPKFYGYVRAWDQTDFSTNQNQFLVKMARLGVKGNVNEYAGYKVFVDFMRLGKLQTSTTSINGTKVITSASGSFSDVGS